MSILSRAYLKSLVWIASLMSAVALGLVSIAALNYRGVCLSQMRTLSEEEKVDAAIGPLLGARGARHFERVDGKLVETNAPTTVPYASVSEFKAANPGCCRTGAAAGDQADEPTFVRRVTGVVADVVMVEYAMRTVGQDGVQTEQKVVTRQSISNCGKAVRKLQF
jgi:hypothetical protein